MRATQFTKNIFTPQVLDEGVNDPAIFKLVFVIGGPGSGKSYITKKLGLGALGFVAINSDHAFEYLMKKHGIDPKMPAHEKERRDIVRQRAKEITANKSELAIDGRLGIVIDGTGDDYEKVATLKKNFDMLGYNNFLVVVNTKLDVARQRNQQRERTVPDEIVVQSWNDVQNNIGKFAQIFENVAIIDNSGTDPAETERQISNTYVKLQKFVAAEPNKPTARRWLERAMLDEGGIFLGELGKSAEYRNPIGIMEFYKFNQVASTEQKNLMKKLIGMKRYEDALVLLKDVTGVAIREAETRTPASTEIRTAMRKHGYKLLGSGQDATVWAKKAGPVVKIIMPSDKRGAGIAGDTFMKFYQFCKEHQGFDNLPKFAEEEVSAFQAEGKDYIMVTMERLSPIPNGSTNEALVWILSDLATKNVSWKEALKVIKNPETWVDYGGGLSPEEIINTVDGYSRKKLLELEVIFSLMTLLYRRGRINKVDWDLHTENAMLRGDTIVITDPWFGQEIEGNG